jgi:hypothetical protein
MRLGTRTVEFGTRWGEAQNSILEILNPDDAVQKPSMRAV